MTIPQTELTPAAVAFAVRDKALLEYVAAGERANRTRRAVAACRAAFPVTAGVSIATYAAACLAFENEAAARDVYIAANRNALRVAVADHVDACST